jgi:Do/DeqQ family serine protease
MNLGSSTLVTAVVSCVAFAAGTAFRSETSKTEAPAAPFALGSVSGETTLAPILARATPAVVSIGVSGRITGERSPLESEPLFGRIFGLSNEPVQRQFMATGSGVIVDAEKGSIVTNNHLIEHADSITAVLHDGRQLEAELVGADPEIDVAVIRVNGEGLTSIAIGDSDALRVGDFVMAIGNPFGLSETATHGIVSALGRTGLGIAPGKYESYIQTDCAINPGNSGGALINMKGELIGINTAIAGITGGNVGIGFAIPVGMVNRIMQQLIEYGAVHRGRLGVYLDDLTPDKAADAGIAGEHGAVIMRVEKGSAADNAGLEVGDVIQSIDGAAVHGSGDLRAMIGVRSVGETVKIQYLRKGKKHTLEARITDPSHPRTPVERA